MIRNKSYCFPFTMVSHFRNEEELEKAKVLWAINQTVTPKSAIFPHSSFSPGISLVVWLWEVGEECGGDVLPWLRIRVDENVIFKIRVCVNVHYRCLIWTWNSLRFGIISLYSPLTSVSNMFSESLYWLGNTEKEFPKLCFGTFPHYHNPLSTLSALEKRKLASYLSASNMCADALNKY